VLGADTLGRRAIPPSRTRASGHEIHRAGSLSENGQFITLRLREQHEISPSRRINWPRNTVPLAHSGAPSSCGSPSSAARLPARSPRIEKGYGPDAVRHERHLRGLAHTHRVPGCVGRMPVPMSRCASSVGFVCGAGKGAGSSQRFGLTPTSPNHLVMSLFKDKSVFRFPPRIVHASASRQKGVLPRLSSVPCV